MTIYIVETRKLFKTYTGLSEVSEDDAITSLEKSVNIGLGTKLRIMIISKCPKTRLLKAEIRTVRWFKHE